MPPSLALTRGVRGSPLLPLALLLLLLLCIAAPLTVQGRTDSKSSKKHGKRHKRAGGDEQEKEWNAATADPKVYTGATARPLTPQLPFTDMPAAFSWCATPEGRSFCGVSWNQHIPRYCGSCYVHGALHAANDRLKLLLDGKHDLTLSRQSFLNCGPAYGLSDGCDGGEVFDVFEYMHRFGLPDESCMNYAAIEAHPGEPERCDPIDICMNCMPSIHNESQTECWAVDPPALYFVTAYGLISGELAIMNEIYRRGPVTCAFATVDDFDYNYRGGVYVDLTNATDSNHDVEVVGWGVDKATQLKYWIARNSWGTYWGENGFFKIVRGVNNMRFEEECVFALFDATDLEQVLSGRWRGGMFGLVDQPAADVTEVGYKDEDNGKQDNDHKEDADNHDAKDRSQSARDWHARR